jgi:diaminopimelate epimerase
MGRAQVGKEFFLKLDQDEVRGIPVSMGNPHYVIQVTDFESGWQVLGRQIATHPHFERGTNVELVKVLNPQEIEVRFYERGVGETQSSGTGSCAAAVASIVGWKVESPVQVHAPGGVQTVESADEVFLTGPATLLCRGEFFI